MNRRNLADAAIAQEPLVTGEELCRMGDIGRCELIEGRIIRMLPNPELHGRVLANLDFVLREFVRQSKCGYIGIGGVGIYIFRDPDTVRGADVVFISNERLAKRGDSGFIDVAPDLVVEVMSPDDRWSEVMKKLGEYFSIGVRLAWVVDPDTESVYAYRSLTDTRHFAKSDALPGDDVLPGFSVMVGELFAE